MTETQAGGGTVDVTIGGMSCGHCVARVRKILGGVSGIESADVAVGSATITIANGDRARVLTEAAAALGAAGYPVRAGAGPEAMKGA